MFVSAAVGIVVNLYIGFGLRAERGENLNVRAAMLHVFGDVAASVGVIIGGLIILCTRWYAADALISLCIALLIARGAWMVLRETLDILMEATPKDLNVAQLVRDVVRMPSISDVHDLHIWSITGGMRALSAHIQVDDQPLSACGPLLSQVNRLLADKYNICHTTIQFECPGCRSDDLYCGMNGTVASDHAHDHAAGDHGHGHPGHGHPADGLDGQVATAAGE
jgi:cobalt-zinc-cadmium efflux system protein